MPILSELSSTALRLMALALVAAPLAACGVDRAVPTASIPEDYHQRHPIALENATKRLDVFLVGNSHRLDPRQERDVESFAAAWRSRGNGRIVALLPSGGGQDARAAATLDAIRHVLARSHVGGEISVGNYPVTDPRLASPVQLSFATVEAHVHRCGDWPEDLASGSSTETFSNRSYWNFGCATQKTISAQIDDPRDLVRPRVEDPADVQMRTRAISNIRAGTDPGTKWAQ